MRHSVPVPSGTGTVLTFQIMAMWTKIKTITLYALIGICCCSMIFSLIGNRKSGNVIKVSFWGTNLPYQYALEEIARRYNEFQSDYEVVISKEDAGNYRTWMSAQLAGGNASDLLMTTPVYADADASNGYLYDLTDALNQPNPYNDEDELWKDSFAGSYLTQVQDKNNPGQWNCVPTSTVSVRIVINKEMLEALIPFNGIEVVTGARVTGYHGGTLTAQVGDTTREIPCDSVILSVGYRENNALYQQLQFEVPELYLLGDAKKVSNIMYAIWDAFEVANHI